TARGECATCTSAIASKLGQPGDDSVLDHRRRRRHLPHSERLIERPDYALHPDSDREWRRRLVPHVHRVVVLVGVGQHFPLEALDDLEHRLPVCWKILGEATLQLIDTTRRRYLTLTASS